MNEKTRILNEKQFSKLLANSMMRLDATRSVAIESRAPVAVNLWFDHVIDAYLSACAHGQDWREACIAAEQTAAQRSRRVLTQKALRSEKGIAYSRQHIQKLIRAGKFPKPFQLPDSA